MKARFVDWMVIVIALIAVAIIVFPSSSEAHDLDPMTEIRYCYTADTVPRDDNGRIKRSSSVTYQFKKIHACPSTGHHTGACPGWGMDHIIPLAVGGCDTVWNLQWLPNELKSAAGELPKDRWERKVYAR